MARIVQKEDPVLREKAAALAPEDIRSGRIRRIIADMKEALAREKDGVALAAPQIGVPLRIFIVSGHIFDPEALARDDKSGEYEDLVFINPEIVKESKKKVPMEEGCLSVRGVYGQVRRAEKVTIDAYNERGEKIRRGASGLLAQIFQHEIDHLNGILFTDKTKNAQEILSGQNNEDS